MSTIPSFTRYQVNPYSLICTNDECKEGLPHYKHIGRADRRKCHKCRKPLQRIKGEPYGPKHYSP